MTCANMNKLQDVSVILEVSDTERRHCQSKLRPFLKYTDMLLIDAREVVIDSRDNIDLINRRIYRTLTHLTTQIREVNDIAMTILSPFFDSLDEKYRSVFQSISDDPEYIRSVTKTWNRRSTLLQLFITIHIIGIDVFKSRNLLSIYNSIRLSLWQDPIECLDRITPLFILINYTYSDIIDEVCNTIVELYTLLMKYFVLLDRD